MASEPLFTTTAPVPDGAGPAGPCGPASPLSPLSPLVPCGTVKFKTAAEVVPEFVTSALVPAAPVVVVPTATVAAVPVKP